MVADTGKVVQKCLHISAVAERQCKFAVGVLVFSVAVGIDRRMGGNVRCKQPVAVFVNGQIHPPPLMTPDVQLLNGVLGNVLFGHILLQTVKLQGGHFFLKRLPVYRAIQQCIAQMQHGKKRQYCCQNGNHHTAQQLCAEAVGNLFTQSGTPFPRRSE